MADKAKPGEGPAIDITTPFALDLKAAARLGAEASGGEILVINAPNGLKGVPAEIEVALLHGDKPALQSIADLFERYRTRPERKTGTAMAQTFDSFCDLVNRHAVPDSVIFADADWQKPSFTAVIDYHESASGGLAAFGKHRVHYPFPLSEEWQAWNKLNGQKMTQEDFAFFLEDRIPELAAPTDAERIWIERDFSVAVATPSQVMDLSRGLQVNVSSKVKVAHTLASGEGQIVWEESHQDAGGLPLKVPGMFMLSIAPFFMGEKMRIPVRLRYRPAGGSIIWMFQIYRPDQFVTEHVRHALADARARTNLPAFEGKPEMAA